MSDHHITPESSALPDDAERSRFLFLEYLYKIARGTTTAPISTRDAAAALGITRAEADAASSYLRQRGLTSGTLEIEYLTPAGIDEYERLVKAPNQATASFPHGASVVNNYNTTIGSMVGSNVMQGSAGGMQNASVNVTAPDDAVHAVANLVKQFRLRLPGIELDPETRGDIETSLDELEAETQEQEPDKGKLRRVLRAVQGMMGGIASNAAGNIAAQPLIHHLQQVLPLLMGNPS